MSVAVAIDSLVYVPEKPTVFSELTSALDERGITGISDLVMRSSVTDYERRVVDRFADAWDIPPPITQEEYRRALLDGGFEDVTVQDVTANSVGRFRKWTTSYRWFTSWPTGRVIDSLLWYYRLDPSAIDEQIRRAHEALPMLQHVIIAARAG